MTLSTRLLATANFVRKNSRVADIGCDHGLLSVLLMKQNIAAKIIACDIGEKPLARAKENFAKHDVTNISLRLSDGLSKILPTEIDDVIIAGMGGETIAKIIDDAGWLASSHYNLILQPMSKHVYLRSFLVNNSFAITSEKCVTEKKHSYVIMSAKYNPALATKQCDDLFYLLGCLQNDMFYVEKQRAKLNKMIKVFQHTGESDRLKTLENILEKFPL